MDTESSIGGIILFDGICVLCEHSIQFVIRHDPEEIFQFAAIQSGSGQKLLGQHADQFTSVDIEGLESFVLLEGGQVWLKSAAWFRILASLDSRWRWLGIFRILPGFITDFFYDFIGQYRYRWFGRRDTCLVPDETLRRRFLDEPY